MKKEQNSQVYYHIPGTVCIIGYGSIGRGFTPLLKRHFTFDRLVIIDPLEIPAKGICDQFLHLGLTADNYKEVLDGVFGEKKGFCVNLSVGTSSKQLMIYCQKRGTLYLDTVKEEWEGFYANENLDISQRSNYTLRQNLLAALKKENNSTTAVSCCGANPGMVSWFVKQGLVNIAKEVGMFDKKPQTREQWAELMRKLGVQGVQIAERDTQRSNMNRPINEFWNTWSVDGFISEGFHQPAETGWGTHETWMPPNAREHTSGPKCGIYLMQPGMNTQIKTWCPTNGPQIGFMVTHDEAISISDYYTVKEGDKAVFRPTCHYAYHPCEDAVSSCLAVLGEGAAIPQENWLILDETNIVEGIDELGVLIYGHEKNAYWYGSQLSNEDTQKMVGSQNATGLQVTSAIVAGMVWAIENPNCGIVETNEMDYERCL